MDEKGKIVKAAGSMSGGTIISRVLGYVKMMVLAYYFGATGFSDAFFLAFRIPNLLRALFAEGSMSAAFVPVLTEYQQKDPHEANKLTRVTLTFITLIAGVVCVLGMVFAPEIVTLIGYGFLETPEKFSLTVLLTRVMFPSLLFISMASILMGALYTRRAFFVPSLAPAIFNVCIIASVMLLASHLNIPILAAAIGVTIGGVMQFAFQTPSYSLKGYSLRPAYEPRHPGLKQILKLIVPVVFGMGVVQINVVVSSVLATFLASGSITYLTYSMLLTQLPVGIFGVAMAMAVLPSLSEHAARKDFNALREDFSFSLRLLFFMSVPAMVGLIVLREPIVNFLFQRGQWDYLDTLGTAEALMFYSFGIWAMVGVKVLTSTFYSMQDTKTPVKAAVVALTANLLLSLALMGPLKHSGLALANALSAMLDFTVLIVLLRKRLGRVEGRRILASFIKISLASAVMGAFAWWVLRGEMWSRSGESLIKACWLFGAIALSVFLYAGLCRILRCEELDFIIKRFIKKEK
jgi:putative peptidoglycan lipid II flippase